MHHYTVDPAVRLLRLQAQHGTYMPSAVVAEMWALRLASKMMERQTPIENLEASYRAVNCLQNTGGRTIEQVDALSDADLLRIPNLGRKSLKEIRKAVSEYLTKEFA